MVDGAVGIGPFKNIVNVGWHGPFALIAFCATSFGAESFIIGRVGLHVRFPVGNDNVRVDTFIGDWPGTSAGQVVTYPVAVEENSDAIFKTIVSSAGLPSAGMEIPSTSVAAWVWMVNVSKLIKMFPGASLGVGIDWGTQLGSDEEGTDPVIGTLAYALYSGSYMDEIVDTFTPELIWNVGEGDTLGGYLGEQALTRTSQEMTDIVLGAHTGAQFPGLLTKGGDLLTARFDAVIPEVYGNYYDWRWDFPDRNLPGVEPFFHEAI